MHDSLRESPIALRRPTGHRARGCREAGPFAESQRQPQQNERAIPVTAPVSAVDIPTSAQQIASVSRGPSRSPIQPPINWNKRIGNRKGRERQPELRIADPEIRFDQRRGGRDTHAVDEIQKVHRAQQRENHGGGAQLAYRMQPPTGNGAEAHVIPLRDASRS